MASRAVVVVVGGKGRELISLTNLVIVLLLHMVTKARSPVMVIIQKIRNC